MISTTLLQLSPPTCCNSMARCKMLSICNHLRSLQCFRSPSCFFWWTPKPWSEVSCGGVVVEKKSPPSLWSHIFASFQRPWFPPKNMGVALLLHFPGAIQTVIITKVKVENAHIYHVLLYTISPVFSPIAMYFDHGVLYIHWIYTPRHQSWCNRGGFLWRFEVEILVVTGTLGWGGRFTVSGQIKIYFTRLGFPCNKAISLTKRLGCVRLL